MNAAGTTARVAVRRAGPDDVSAILALIRALAAYERCPDAVEATEATLGEALFGPGAIAYAHVATVEGRIVGTAVWFLNFSTWTGKAGLYLEDLFVDETVRRLGVGQALLAALAAEAVSRDLPRLDWAVLDWNTPAMDFYRRIGATHQAEWQPWRLQGDALAALALTAG